MAENNRIKPFWSPQPRQRDFMARPEFEALYGEGIFTLAD